MNRDLTVGQLIKILQNESPDLLVTVEVPDNWFAFGLTADNIEIDSDQDGNGSLTFVIDS